MTGNAASNQKYSRRLRQIVTNPVRLITNNAQMYKNFTFQNHAPGRANLLNGYGRSNQKYLTRCMLARMKATG